MTAKIEQLGIVLDTHDALVWLSEKLEAEEYVGAVVVLLSEETLTSNMFGEVSIGDVSLIGAQFITKAAQALEED